MTMDDMWDSEAHFFLAWVEAQARLDSTFHPLKLVIDLALLSRIRSMVPTSQK
jgi:hypothetical protein